MKIQLILLLLGTSLSSAQIKHGFLIGDEGRDKITFVDENDSSRYWSVATPASARDMQLIGNNRVLLSIAEGYQEYDLDKGVRKKNVTGFSDIISARRLPNGNTLIATETSPVKIIELNTADKEIHRITFATTASLHLFRQTLKGTFLLACDTKILECDSTGKVIWQSSPPGASHLYKGVRLADGNTVVSTGFGNTIQILDAKGTSIKTIRANTAPEAIRNNFYADFQLLTNGHYLVTNWQDHADLGYQGIQLMELDDTGKILWYWKKPALMGSLHQIILMDDVDPTLLHDEREGFMVAVQPPVGIQFGAPLRSSIHLNPVVRLINEGGRISVLRAVAGGEAEIFGVQGAR